MTTSSEIRTSDDAHRWIILCMDAFTDAHKEGNDRDVKGSIAALRKAIEEYEEIVGV